MKNKVLELLISVNDNYELLKEKIEKKDNFYEELREYLEITPEKERNLRVKIARYFIETKGVELDKRFEEKDLKEKLFFKKSDILFFSAIFFNLEGDKNYTLNEKEKKKIKEYIDKNLENKDTDITNYKTKFLEIKNLIYRDGKYEEANQIQDKLLEETKKLHWKYLPIYTETMLDNRGIIPEENVDEYYNHFHSLEDLYDEIMGRGISWRTTEGDENLNREMEFQVYTSRWGHNDIYRIERDIFGWKVHHISLNGLSLKNGEGSLFSNLNHDSIFYPKDGVEYALSTLWKEADLGEINFEELRNKLQEIGDWISDVERSLRRKQPDWCNYY